MEFIIETRSLEYVFPDGTRALRDISLRIRRGSRVAILGANGAGKTTLFWHFNGLLKPTRGCVLFEGKPLQYDRRSLRELRRRVGLLFQDPEAQIIHPVVEEDVAFGLVNAGFSRGEIEERLRNALEAVGLVEYRRKPVHYLSYGLKKRVALAGVIALQPEVLVLDEPTAGLDPISVRGCMEILNRFHAQGITIVISTHDVDLAYSWADEVIILHAGGVVRQGVPWQVMASASELEMVGLEVPQLLAITELLQRHHLLPAGVYPRSINEITGLLSSFRR